MLELFFVRANNIEVDRHIRLKAIIQVSLTLYFNPKSQDIMCMNYFTSI